MTALRLRNSTSILSLGHNGGTVRLTQNQGSVALRLVVGKGDKGDPGPPGSGSSNSEVAGYVTASGSTKTALDAAYGSRTGKRPSGQGEIVLVGDDYSVPRNGVTDATTALSTLFSAADALADTANSFGATVVVYLRAGRYIDSGSRTLSKRIVIRGDGKFNTILYRKSASTGDYLTFTGQYAGLDGVTVDGNRYNCPSGGDNVVLDAYRTFVANSLIVKATGNGITIGKSSAALGHRLTLVDISECAAYGAQTVSASGSTDGVWHSMDVGLCGKTGVQLDNGAQHLVSVHSWGNGLEDATDKHGININSASNVLTDCEGETNNGDGLYVSGSGSTGNSVIGGKFWGNVGAGIRIFSATRGVITGVHCYRNGVGNTTGSTSPSFAGILNDSGQEWAISGCNVWDDTNAVGAGSYTTAPTFPFPGKTAGTFMQPNAYAEVGTADFNTLAGNVMRKERTRSGTALVIVGNSDRIAAGGNDFGATTTVPTQANSGGTVRVPALSDTVIISSNAAITAIAGGFAGRRVTLIFTAAAPGAITHATTLRLAGSVNYTPTQNSTLTLVHDGSGWRETSRTAA